MPSFKATLAIIFFATLFRIIFTVYNNPALTMNPDEESNYQIAANAEEGRGYVYFDVAKKEYFESAFQASFPAFTYQFLIRNHIPKNVWVAFVLSAGVALFAVSLYYFYLILGFFNVGAKNRLAALAVWCFYPSFQYYVGSLFAYENIVLPLLVINVYFFLKLLNNRKLSIPEIAFMVVSIDLSVLFRPHALFIYPLVFLTAGILIGFNRNRNAGSVKTYALLLLTVLVTATALHIPILQKTHKQFGAYILSTQSGFELLQGHNPYARGSWLGTWQDPEGEFYKYVKAAVPQIDSLNQYEESNARKELALNFVKNNPVKEVELVLRKMAAYFLPMNYEFLPSSQWYNPINLLVHVLFLISVGVSVFNLKRITRNEWFILAPVVASVGLTLIFFAGYRWRYYAEPFMIIFAAVTIGNLVYKLKQRAVNKKLQVN
jgi:hypothetical protein